MKSPKERAEERRQEKLDEIQAQVADGSLKIRKMTPAEREQNPPRPPRQPGRRGR